MQSTEAGFALSLYLKWSIVLSSGCLHCVLISIPGQNGQKFLSGTGNWCMDSVP